MKGFKFLTSPYILSVIPFLVIVIILPFRFNKYLLEPVNSVILNKDSYVWFDDLDNDGSSEKLVLFDFHNSSGLTISNDNGIIDQWNLRGTFDFSLKKCLFITGDKDNDGKKEVYVFTLSNDTVLLHCISNPEDPLLSIKNRFIAVAGPGIKKPDPFIIAAEMDDLDGDGIGELIFGIGTGFSQYPRNVFAYFISKDSMTISPESSYFIQNILQADINGDGKREIIPYGYSAANISPDRAEYHDYSSFLMVLDQQLRFQFKPVEFKGKYSGLTPVIIRIAKENSLAVLFHPPAEQTNSTIYKINKHGIISDSVGLDFNAVYCSYTSVAGDDFYLLAIPQKGIGLLNSSLDLIKLEPHYFPYTIIQMDLDADGRNELIVPEPQKGNLVIYNEGLTNPVSAIISMSGDAQYNVSLKLDKKSDPLLSIQSNQSLTFLRYRQNPSYPFYYAYYLIVYSGILGFALIIKNIQKNQLKKKYDNEKKISELQLALIRNQLDPHFTFNAINSIIYSVYNSDKEEACEGLRRFANLYRNLLLSADTSRRTLREEMEFCNDYLQLEKIRFGDKFEYRINHDEDVDNEILIPKMLVQIHAENALKHGLAPLDSGGLLDINLKRINTGLLIEITDNGIGRKKSAGNSGSTGKGLKIMDELYSIYNKYYSEKVSSEIVDLYDTSGHPAGTKVLIRINGQYEKN